MKWDAEIWAPCRLGEAFILWDLGFEGTAYLYSIKADWMGDRGDAMAARFPEQLKLKHPCNLTVGAGPRPWTKCWTYEAKIKITPPVWCWDMQDDTMFGLDFKPKRNGARRKVKLNMVQIYEGRPVYCITVEMPDGNEWKYLDSIPVLDPYFAPIWPENCRICQEAEKPVPEPVAVQVAETVPNTRKAEQTPEKLYYYYYYETER